MHKPSFFLPPHAEIVKLCWSRGRRREKRDLHIERVDCRTQFMSFEFNSRTKDNVELVLEGTFFWKVESLKEMVQATGDTTGDLCSHTRCRFIEYVAQNTLEQFMSGLAKIADDVCHVSQGFFKDRGVRVESLEVTSYRCAEATTSEILHKITQETTNRMNRLKQQDSENEVNVTKAKGQLQQAELKKDLQDIQGKQKVKNAEVAGNAESLRVSSFLMEMEEAKEKVRGLAFEDQKRMWQKLRTNEALTALSKSRGGSTIYFVPQDVDLAIESNS